MNSENSHLEHLAEIRSLMERSARFISLSGLSGVVAGIFALMGAYAAHLYLDVGLFSRYNFFHSLDYEKWGLNPMEFFVLDAAIVLFLAISFGVFFTYRKAKKAGQQIWDKTALRMLINLLIPLATGGIVCLIFAFKYYQGGFVAPLTLIFYGLALINGSKYTLDDIRYLGMLEIALGLISLYFIGYGLLFWAIGFGVLHIVYGTLMYFKYER